MIGFIALSDVSIESGPTYLYEGTHTKKFHDSLHLSRDKQSTYYSSDGGMEETMSMVGIHDDQSIAIDHHHGDEVANKVGSSFKTDVCDDSRENYNDEIDSSGLAIHHIHHQSQSSSFNSLVPIHFHLQIGDILLFNSMIFHYGAKNNSIESRPLLSFSFQNVDSISKQLIYIDGFTYHSHHTIRDAHLTVSDFPVIR